MLSVNPEFNPQAQKTQNSGIQPTIIDAGASTTNNENSILIMENSDSGGCEALETPNLFLNPSIVSFVTILIWSCFIIERFVLQVKVVVSLFNLESLFPKSK